MAGVHALCAMAHNACTPDATDQLQINVRGMAIHEEDYWLSFQGADAAGKNNFFNHAKKCGHSIQPDSDTLKYVPDGPPLVQVVHRFFPLYKT